LGELHDWLIGQHPGLKTYKSFREKVLRLASSDTEHRALYRLLANMAGHFIATFDEAPLPVDVAMVAYERLLGIVDDAEKSMALPISQQVDVLNKIAATELF
jgi:hypothetical protein